MESLNSMSGSRKSEKQVYSFVSKEDTNKYPFILVLNWSELSEHKNFVLRKTISELRILPNGPIEVDLEPHVLQAINQFFMNGCWADPNNPRNYYYYQTGTPSKLAHELGLNVVKHNTDDSN